MAHDHDEHEKKERPKHKRPVPYLAEFETSGKVMRAAEKVRDAGYKRWDVHTPFPVHGMDKAMGLPDSRLGWIVLVSGLTGLSAAFLLMWFTNGVDYPIVIGGKPGFSLPSMVPVMFELTILLSAFGTVFGMFGLNQLPRHHHPVFYSDRFDRATDDRFFISVEAGDENFDLDATKALLEKAGATHLELIQEES